MEIQLTFNYVEASQSGGFACQRKKKEKNIT